MRIGAWLWAAVLAAGCVEGHVETCEIESNCTGAATCWKRAGEAMGVCVEKPTAVEHDAGVAEDAGPSTDGGGTPDAGLDGGEPLDGGMTPDGGLDAGTPADAGPPCASVVCGDEWECRPNASGAGECVSAFSGISWVTPVDGTWWGDAAAVDLHVTLNVKPGFAPRAMPNSLSLASSPDQNTPFPAVLTRTSDGGYQAHFTLATTAANDTWTLTAGYPDAGLSASRTVSTDTHAPSVGLKVFPAPPRRADGGVLNDVDLATGYDAAYKRSESVLVEVSTSELASVGPSDFKGAFSGDAGPTVTTCPTSSPCSNSVCTCFLVDLWKPTFDQYHGTLMLELGPLADRAGNLSAGNTHGLAVTRFKWARTLPLDANAYVLGEDGTVFVRQSRALSALTPSGEPRFPSLSLQESTSGLPMVLGPFLYQRLITTGPPRTASTLRVNTATGATEATHCTHDSIEVESSAPLLVGARVPSGATLQDTIFSAMAATDGGTLLAIQPGAAAECQGTSFPLSTESPGGLVAAGPSLAANVGGRLARATWDGGWASCEVGATTSLQGAPLAVTGGNVVWGTANGASSVTLSSTSTAAATVGAPGGYSVTVGGLPGARLTYLGTGNNGDLAVWPFTEGDPGSFGSVAAHETTWSRAPVLGAKSLGYFDGPATVLSVRSTPSLVSRWSTPTNLGISATTLSLDVARTAQGAKRCEVGGVLYALGTFNPGSGNVPVLAAIDVDSPGLDPTAPWPMLLHDPANTANAATPLGPWTCP